MDEELTHVLKVLRIRYGGQTQELLESLGIFSISALMSTDNLLPIPMWFGRATYTLLNFILWRDANRDANILTDFTIEVRDQFHKDHDELSKLVQRQFPGDNFAEEYDKSLLSKLYAVIAKNNEEDGFKGPRFSLKDGKGFLDYHAWCVDDRGNICDYKIDQLQSGVYPSQKLVYRPWSAHLVVQILPHLDAMFTTFMEQNKHCSESDLVREILQDRFPPDNCYIRAKLLHRSNVRKFNIVIGSLGFEQSDGRIFWESG